MTMTTALKVAQAQSKRKEQRARERVTVCKWEWEGERVPLSGEVAKVLQALYLASSIRQFVTGPTQSYFSYSLTYATTTAKKSKAMPNKATAKWTFHVVFALCLLFLLPLPSSFFVSHSSLCLKFSFASFWPSYIWMCALITQQTTAKLSLAHCFYHRHTHIHTQAYVCVFVAEWETCSQLGVVKWGAPDKCWEMVKSCSIKWWKLPQQQQHQHKQQQQYQQQHKQQQYQQQQQHKQHKQQLKNEATTVVLGVVWKRAKFQLGNRANVSKSKKITRRHLQQHRFVVGGFS